MRLLRLPPGVISFISSRKSNPSAAEELLILNDEKQPSSLAPLAHVISSSTRRPYMLKKAIGSDPSQLSNEKCQGYSLDTVARLTS
jgi:hypothetical protein